MLFINQLKTQWIMEELTTSSEIIVKLDKMHKNMVADGSWVTTNKKDTKIVALILSFQEIKNRFGELAKRVSFSGDQKGGGNTKKNGGGKGNATDGSAKTMKTRCPEWQVTKKGSAYIHEGKKYTLGVLTTIRRTVASTGSTCLLPTITMRGQRPKRIALRSSRRASTTRRRVAMGSGSGPANKKHKPDNKLKLTLSDKLTQALVTQHHLSQTEADDLFSKAYKEAEDKQEN